MNSRVTMSATHMTSEAEPNKVFPSGHPRDGEVNEPVEATCADSKAGKI